MLIERGMSDGSCAQLQAISRWRVTTMPRQWTLRNGKTLVVEDATTASLVIVARDLETRRDKIAAVEEVLRELTRDR